MPLLGSAATRGFLLYAVLPNVVFLAASGFLYLLHPIVNVDYVLVWAVSAVLRPAWTAILYAVSLLLDVAVSAEGIYEFSTADLLANLQYVDRLDPARVATIAVVIFAGVALVVALTVRRAGRLPSGGSRGRAAVALVALVATISLSAVEFWKHPLDPTKAVHVLGSRALEVVESAFAVASVSDGAQRAYAPAEWRGRRLLRDLKAHTGSPPYDVVLVVVESEGLLREEGDEAKVLAPLTGPDIRARYEVKQGAIRFAGSTLSGELRALCGLRGAPVEAENARRLPDCLPKLMARRGYRTLGLHGNSGNFFDRVRWYPALGFERNFFEEEMRALSRRPLATCGTMIQGLCDADVADFVEKELSRPDRRPTFVYWLTLSSHLPVDARLARESHFDCGATTTLRGEDGPCDLARILHLLHRRVAAIALDPAVAPTRFILVGDHAPVFTERSERSLYDDERVPFLDLVPLAAASP